MGLFKSGRDKADDLLVILIPALKCEIETQIRRRLLEEMEDIVQDAAQQVVRYSFSEVINQLSIDVRVPKKEWVGLTDEERRYYNDRLSGSGVAEEIEAKIKEKNGG